MNESAYMFSNAMPIIIRMSLNALKKPLHPGCSFSIQVFVRERTGSLRELEFPTTEIMRF
jgi:hypothetical protein